MVCTVSEQFIKMRRTLKDAGFSSYALEAKELLAAAMGVRADEIPRNLNLFLSESTVKKADELVARRLAHEPCAYIIGEWDFYSLTFAVSPDVLIPRPDTEALVDRVLSLKLPEGSKSRILDLCTGCGCIGIALAHRMPEARVVLMDISPAALHLAKENIRRHGQQGRVYTCQTDARAGWIAAYGRFDLIVANPPYIPSADFAGLDLSVRGFEPRLALDGGDDGLDFYRAIAEKWKEGLVSGGRIAVECGYDQAGAVADIFKKAGLRRVSVSKDLAGVDRIVTGCTWERRAAEDG